MRLHICLLVVPVRLPLSRRSVSPSAYHVRTNLMPSNSHNHMPISRSPLLVLPAVDSGVDLLSILSTLPSVCSVVLSSTLSTPLFDSCSTDSVPIVAPPTQLHYAVRDVCPSHVPVSDLPVLLARLSILFVITYIRSSRSGVPTQNYRRLYVVESKRSGMEPVLTAKDAISHITRKYPDFVEAIFVVNKDGVHAGVCHGWTYFQYSVRTLAMKDVEIFTVLP
ncbi:hypothetical protein Sjap_012904 [Stephania japonica]|uniref:Uncharacterized protein n=1 Tax=Stephania japonica TaxID=461633 RepID=A0AAP0IYW9_9MAGN